MIVAVFASERANAFHGWKETFQGETEKAKLIAGLAGNVGLTVGQNGLCRFPQ